MRAQQIRSNIWQRGFWTSACYVGFQKQIFQKPLNFINGTRIGSFNNNVKDDIIVLDPSSGAELCVMRESGRTDVDAAVDSAHKAFLSWSESPLNLRSQILHSTALLVRKYCDDIAWIETKDNGKPFWESKLDTEGCADAIEWYSSLAYSLAGRYVSLPNNSHGYTRPEPLGVIGAIGAFNYPFQMACWKAAAALACGNTVVFKPSPLTPLSAVILAELFTEAGLPTGCFNIVQGNVNTAQLMCSHPKIAKISFTGSVATGSKIMESCAKDIKKVTLELGGKSPLLIFADCDLENAVKGTLMANFLTQGQVCSNGTRVFVHRNIFKPFVTDLVHRTRAIKVGDPMLKETHMGAMISAQHAQQVLDYIETAKQEGAQVECGGYRVQLDGLLKNGWYIAPCVLTGVQDSMKVAKEEIFGPVISILEFEDEDEVVQRANSTQFGLASGLFTRDIKRAHRVASKLQAGNVYINNYNVFPPMLPFGGHKKSGLGVECGVESLTYYTQWKTVYIEGGDVSSPFP